MSDLAQVGERKAQYGLVQYFRIIIHSKFFRRDFCFVMKITNSKSTFANTGSRHLEFKFNDLFNEHFPKLVVFQKYFVAKAGEVNCY